MPEVSVDAMVALPGHTVVLSGLPVRAMATAAEHFVRLQRTNGVRDPLMSDLLEVLRAAAAGSAAELTRVPSAGGVPTCAVPDDLSVAEAAELMTTSTRNVRARCLRGSLVASKFSGEWVISRADVLSKLERKAG